jgi:hypothetical protein
MKQLQVFVLFWIYNHLRNTLTGDTILRTSSCTLSPTFREHVSTQTRSHTHTHTYTHTNIYSFHAQNRTHKEKDRPYKAKAVPQPTKVSNPISICCRAPLEKARRGPAVAYALVYACNLEPAVIRTTSTAADPSLQEDILVGSPVRYTRRFRCSQWVEYRQPPQKKEKGEKKAVSASHSPSHSQTSRRSINLVSIFRCSSPPRNPVYARRVDHSALAFSLSSHRHSYISLLFRSRFIDS